MSHSAQFNRIGVGKTFSPAYRIDAADSSRFQDALVSNTLNVSVFACTNTFTTPYANIATLVCATSNAASLFAQQAHVANFFSPNIVATQANVFNLYATSVFSPTITTPHAVISNAQIAFMSCTQANVANVQCTQANVSTLLCTQAHVTGTLTAANVIAANVLSANNAIVQNLVCVTMNTGTFFSNTVSAGTTVSAPLGLFTETSANVSSAQILRTPRLEANVAVLSTGIATPVQFVDAYGNGTVSVTSEGVLNVGGMLVSSGLIAGRVTFIDPINVPSVGAGGIPDPQFSVHASGTVAADTFYITNPFDGFLIDKLTGSGTTDADRCGLKLIGGSAMHVYAPESVCLGSAQTDGSIDKTLVVTSSNRVGVRNFDPQFSLDVLGTVNASEKMQAKCFSVYGDNYTSGTLPSHGIGYTNVFGQGLTSSNGGVFPTLCGTSGLNFQVGGANKVTINPDGMLYAPHVAGYTVTSNVGFASPGFAVTSSGHVQTSTVSLTGGGLITGSPGNTVRCPGQLNAGALSVASGALRVDGTGALIMTQPFRPVSINTGGALYARDASFSNAGLRVLTAGGNTGGQLSCDTTGVTVMSASGGLRVATDEFIVTGSRSSSMARLKVNADGLASHNTFTISNFGYIASPILSTRTDRLCIGSANDYLGLFPGTTMTNTGATASNALSLNTMSVASTTVKTLLFGPNVGLPSASLGIGTNAPASPLDVRNCNTGSMILSVNASGVYANVNVYAPAVACTTQVSCLKLVANVVQTTSLTGAAISSDIVGSNSSTVAASTAGVLAAILGNTNPSKITLGRFTLSGDDNFFYLAYQNTNVVMVNTQGQIFSSFSKDVIKFSVSLSTLVATSDTYSSVVFSWNEYGSLFTDIQYTLDGGSTTNASLQSSLGTYRVTGLIANKSYLYTFIPKNIVGGITSTGNTYTGTFVTMGSLLGVSLSTTMGVAAIVVSWTSGLFMSVKFSLDEGSTWTTFTVSSGVLTHTISSGLVIGNTYAMLLEPVNSAGQTGATSSLSCTIPYSAVVSGLTTEIYDTSVVFTWSSGRLAALKYNVGNGDVLVQPITTNTMTVTGLTPFTLYNPVVLTPCNDQLMPNLAGAQTLNIRTRMQFTTQYRILYNRVDEGQSQAFIFFTEYGYPNGSGFTPSFSDVQNARIQIIIDTINGFTDGAMNSIDGIVFLYGGVIHWGNYPGDFVGIAEVRVW